MSALLILDDVWNRLDVNAFDVLGPRCRCLITTRDAGMLESLGDPQHVLDLLTDGEACDLLARTAGIDLPPEAGDILGECGRLPLAVALCGGLLRRGMRGDAIVQQLRQARIDRIADRHAIEPHHQSVWHAIHVSVAVLPEDECRRFLELAVFGADEAVPTAAIGVLWSHTGGCDDWATRELLTTLRERSLLVQKQHERIELHDLIHDYLRHSTPEPRPLHEAMLAAYAGRCRDGWATGPNDGHFFTHLRTHLGAAGRRGEMVPLMCDHRWLEAKAEAGVVGDLLADFGFARRVATEGEEARFLRLVEEAIRRDLPFVARHPTTLFQCLWNSCWWYDCPEAEAHYEPPEGGWGANGPPWTRSVLAPWMAKCREAKERAGTFVWVRSLRPPAVPLGGALRTVCTGHQGYVTEVAFSPDGRMLASGSYDYTIRLWDGHTGQQFGGFLGHQDRVTKLAWSRDGRTLASGSFDKTVRLWDSQSGKQLACLQGHEDRVYTLSWKAGGNTLASGSKDKTVRLWDGVTGQQLACLKGHQDAVSTVSWCDDGSTLASGSDDCTVRLWDSQSGQQLASLKGHQNWVYTVSWSGDGRTFASGSADNTVRLWDASTGQQIACLQGHEMTVDTLSWSADGRNLRSGDAGGGVILWDVPTRRRLSDEEYQRLGAIDSQQRSPHSRLSAVNAGGEVTFVPAGKAAAIAWLSGELVCDTVNGRNFSAYSGSELYLLRLEGVPANDG